ncbi:MAG TPA: hypothetical protein VN970_02060 [Thermoanaerobaculia bacterium]|nr:hypothetical protein [Thermoanaerobaculia bacterium]
MSEVALLPRAGLDCAWGIARTAGQMMLLPWNVFASMAGGVARMATSAGTVAVRAIPAPAAASEASTNPGAAIAVAATTFRKETKQMSEDRCDIDDCKIKLYRYTIVSIRRGAEDILYSDQVLIRDPMDECDFDNYVIAEFVKHHPKARGLRWLRVCSELQCTWDKQPLHYEEKQLGYLRTIAHSVRKIGGPEDDDDRPRRHPDDDDKLPRRPAYGEEAAGGA